MEIPNRTTYDAAFARRMSRLNSRHRRELIALLGHPPDVRRVGPEFWERVRRENEEELLVVLLLLYSEAFEYHARLGGAAKGELSAAGRSGAEQYAKARAASIAANVADSARKHLDQVAADDWAKVGQDAKDVITKTKVLADAIKMIGPIAAARIAVTETTAAQSAGGEAGIAATVGLSNEDEWRIHPEKSMTGTCKICRPYDGRPRRIWSIDFPMGPPCHANCNCEIVYANVPGAGVVVPG